MKLILELRRRNVLRMAVLYLVAAWLIMQVGEVLVTLAALPYWTGRIVLVLLAIGFPIALIFSWFYEVTPEGISLEKDIDRAKSITHITGRRLDFIVISMLCAAVLVFAYDKWWTGPPPDRSVAVLPFVNMSADEESAYVAAGVADTILNMLAQVPGLHVAARTSSFQPRLNGLGAGEIADLLGVGSVLEGSVQRQGDRLRITAQLINAKDESHLWSRSFDRDYGDVFAIQDEIAEAVMSALELSLQGQTKQRIDREGTDNLEAFEEYSRAIGNLRARTTESVQRAVEQLQHAIEFDPDFARAHAMLGVAYLDGRYRIWSELGQEEVVDLARHHATSAIQIAPGLSTALTLLGYLTNDDDVRGQLYREAVGNGPNDALALRAYADHLFFVTLQVDEAAELSEKVIRLDPLDEGNYGTLAIKQVWRNQPHACLETTTRGMEKVSESVLLRDLASLCYYALGDYSSAIASEYETLQFDSRAFWNRYEIGILYLVSGMPDQAERWLDSAAAYAPEGDLARHLKSMLLDMYHQRNDEAVFAALRQWVLEGREISLPYFDRVRPLFIEYGARLDRLDEVLATFEELYPRLFSDQPYDLEITSVEDASPLFAIGLALLRRGDVYRGNLLMQAVLKKFDVWGRVWFVYPGSVTGRLAQGETEAALETFRAFAAKNKWHIGMAELVALRHSRLYDPIREEPEFIELLNVYHQNAAEQRRRLNAMDLPVK